MTTEVSAARTRLHDALVAGSATQPWRIHRVTPGQIAAPTVFIDSVELTLDPFDGGQFINATFPIIIVADGAVGPQVEALDDLIAHVWDAAATVGEPTDTRPINLDVGGPSLRAQMMRVGMFITARTLCPSQLATVGGTHAQ